MVDWTETQCTANCQLFLGCFMQGERDGIWAWQRINQLFNWLPLAALIERKIICMHGGIGRSINHVHQIEDLQRPITMEAGSVVLMDLLWYNFSVYSIAFTCYLHGLGFFSSSLSIYCILCTFCVAASSC